MRACEFQRGVGIPRYRDNGDDILTEGALEGF